MTAVIVGAGGVVGSALYARVGGFGTTHEEFDLKDDPGRLPDADLVYIIAAKSKFRDCELDEDAWEVNVDAPIRIAARYSTQTRPARLPAQFIVYVSSEAATWGRTSYGIQKSHAELGLIAVCRYHRLAIVRPKKLTPERINPLCELLWKIGTEQLCGVHKF